MAAMEERKPWGRQGDGQSARRKEGSRRDWLGCARARPSELPEHSRHDQLTQLKQRISCCLYFLTSDYSTTLVYTPQNDQVNHGRSQQWLPKWNRLSSVPSDLASLRLLIKWAFLSSWNFHKTICFLPHLLIFLLTHCLLLLSCFPLKCSHSLKFYTWPSLILTVHVFLGNLFDLMATTITCKWWLSNVCLHSQAPSWAPVAYI